MIPEIICGIIGLIVWEVFYLLMCKETSERDFENEWLNCKMGSLVLAIIVSAGCYAIYYACKEAMFELLLVLLGVVGLGLFLYINHEIGLYVCKNKHKKKGRVK